MKSLTQASAPSPEESLCEIPEGFPGNLPDWMQSKSLLDLPAIWSHRLKHLQVEIKHAPEAIKMLRLADLPLETRKLPLYSLSEAVEALEVRQLPDPDRTTALEQIRTVLHRLGLDMGLDQGLLRYLLPSTTIKQLSNTIHRMTREELSASIGRLTAAELNRVRRYAAWRVTMLGWKAEGRTADDVLNEAILATLDGRRVWDPARVDLCHHLKMAIRSQSWARQKKKSVVELMSQSILEDSEGNSRFEAMTSEEPAVEAAVMLDQILGSLEGDPEAHELAKLLAQERTVSEICEELGFTTGHYRTVARRVRAIVARLTGQ